MAENDTVNSMITDAVTQASVQVVADSPALSVAQSYLSAAQANGVLFANLVAEQQRLAVAGQAATVSGVTKTLGANGGTGGLGVAGGSGIAFKQIMDQVQDRASDILSQLKQNATSIEKILDQVVQTQQEIRGKVDKREF